MKNGSENGKDGRRLGGRQRRWTSVPVPGEWGTPSHDRDTPGQVPRRGNHGRTDGTDGSSRPSSRVPSLLPPPTFRPRGPGGRPSLFLTDRLTGPWSSPVLLSGHLVTYLGTPLCPVLFPSLDRK